MTAAAAAAGSVGCCLVDWLTSSSDRSLEWLQLPLGDQQIAQEDAFLLQLNWEEGGRTPCSPAPSGKDKP